MPMFTDFVMKIIKQYNAKILKDFLTYGFQIPKPMFEFVDKIMWILKCFAFMQILDILGNCQDIFLSYCDNS